MGVPRATSERTTEGRLSNQVGATVYEEASYSDVKAAALVSHTERRGWSAVCTTCVTKALVVRPSVGLRRWVWCPLMLQSLRVIQGQTCNGSKIARRVSAEGSIYRWILACSLYVSKGPVDVWQDMKLDKAWYKVVELTTFHQPDLFIEGDLNTDSLKTQ